MSGLLAREILSQWWKFMTKAALLKTAKETKTHSDLAFEWGTIDKSRNLFGIIIKKREEPKTKKSLKRSHER
jgi:hypothetical protein